MSGNGGMPLDIRCNACGVHGSYDPPGGGAPFTGVEQLRIWESHRDHGDALCPHDQAFIGFERSPGIPASKWHGWCPICGSSVHEA